MLARQELPRSEAINGMIMVCQWRERWKAKTIKI